jgi:EAL domain-containing protein (putative c-di-GMP-specific phosphodiesterase class I)/CheY-like chemotaxis protein
MDIRELRFLVVEDQGFQRWIVGNLLEGLGAQYVFSASDGREALELLASREPAIDIIVTDLDMPGMDGMEFIRHVSEAGYAASLILASSMERSLISSVEAMARAYGLNLLGAISKPVNAAKLEEAIRHHPDAGSTAAAKPPAPEFSVAEIAAGLANGEFLPFFQPKVDVKTQVTRGAEAVARWRHPTLGIIRPESFIGIVEQNGLMEDLTRMMLKEAAGNCARWRRAGLDATVSVNLSLTSLHDITLTDRVMALVDAEGLEPKHVIFEVTESAAVSDLGRTLENLSRLRMKGFGLSIDDYGTGYSSMERLARIPFTELKIDQSFVKNASTDKASRAMLESGLEMAQKLGIVAVAEGVESRADWDLVRSLRCPIVQGYFIARPMDAGEFLSWARMRRNATA